MESLIRVALRHRVVTVARDDHGLGIKGSLSAQGPTLPTPAARGQPARTTER